MRNSREINFLNCIIHSGFNTTSNDSVISIGPLNIIFKFSFYLCVFVSIFHKCLNAFEGYERVLGTL